MGPCYTGRENNRSDGFVSPLFRQTHMCFVPCHVLCPLCLGLFAEDRGVDITSPIYSQCLSSLENQLSPYGWSYWNCPSRRMALPSASMGKPRHRPIEMAAFSFLMSRASGALGNTTLLKPGSAGFPPTCLATPQPFFLVVINLASVTSCGWNSNYQPVEKGR